MRPPSLLLPLLLLYAGCTPDFPSGEITCDPRSTGQCPKGQLCLESLENPGIYLCYSSQSSPLGFCGDGELQPDYEQCDYKGFSLQCRDLGYHIPEGETDPSLSCTNECELIQSACEAFPRCGDLEVQPAYEECDGETQLPCYPAAGTTRGFALCTDQCSINNDYCFPSVERNVDLLFIVDDLSREETSNNIPKQFLQNLQNLYASTYISNHGYLNFHYGVISSAVPTPGLCAPPGSPDKPGTLLAPQECSLFEGASFFKDYAPRCDTHWDPASNTCSFQECQQGCNQYPGNLRLVVNGNGCPRCVNIDTRPTPITRPETVPSCLALKSATKPQEECAIRQPLLALQRALENPDNTEFFRPDAVLVVVFVTTQDDCSIAKERLDAFMAMDPAKSPALRCAMRGMRCQTTWDTMEGMDKELVFGSCTPRTEQDNVRHLLSIESLVERVRELRIENSSQGGGIEGTQNLILLSLSGTFTGTLVVTATDTPEENNNASAGPDRTYSLKPSCTGIFPAPRLQEFVSHFSGFDPNHGDYSICSSTGPGEAISSLVNTINTAFQSNLVIQVPSP